MKNLLYLCHRLPYPPNKGDKIRSFHWLKYLARRYRIYLATFIDDPNDWQYIPELKNYCTDYQIIALQPTRAKLRSLRGLLTDQPLTVPYYSSRKLKRWLNRLLAKHFMDHALIFSGAMAQYLPENFSGSRIIDFVDVDSDKWLQYSRNKSWPMTWVYQREHRTLMAYERQVAKTMTASFFVSADEALLFQQIAPESMNKICFVGNGVDTDYFNPTLQFSSPFGKSPVIAFTGAMDYWANIDAVCWFANHIFPLIRRQSSHAEFFIVGTNPGDQVWELNQQPGITVTGAVPDIRPYLYHAHTVVAPLRIARGIQNKVLEAMAMAKTIVATPQAMEGIDLPDTWPGTITDIPNTFANAVIRHLQSPLPYQDHGSRQWVERQYHWEQKYRQLQDILENRE